MGAFPSARPTPGQRGDPHRAPSRCRGARRRSPRATRPRPRPPRGAHPGRLPLRATGAHHRRDPLSFPAATPDAAELEFLEILADTCAQALERIRPPRRPAADRPAVFLADASIELASSLDSRRRSQVARLAVPTFADWCAIDVVADGRLHRLAVAHVDPQGAARRSSCRSVPADPDAPTGRGGSCAPADRADRRDHRRDAGAGGATRSTCASPASSQLRSALTCRWWPGAGSSASSRGCRPRPTGSTARTTSRSPRTWPGARRSPSTTPSCTARPWPRPSSCSTRCCPRRWPASPAGRSPATTAPRAARRSAATSTTPFALSDGRLRALRR